MTVAQPIDSKSIITTGSSNFTDTLKNILELLDLEEDDDYGILKPTEYALKTVIALVIEAYEIIGNKFPEGSTCTDDRGGITVDWTSKEPRRKVRLFCPSTSEQSIDIYHSQGDQASVEDVVSVSTLVYWLQWFNEG